MAEYFRDGRLVQMRLRSESKRTMAQLAPANAAGIITATLGAIALGALAIARVLFRKPAYETPAPTDDLVVVRVRVREFMRDDVPPPPIR